MAKIYNLDDYRKRGLPCGVCKKYVKVKDFVLHVEKHIRNGDVDFLVNYLLSRR